MYRAVRYGMVGGDIHAFIGAVHRKGIRFNPKICLVAGCFSASSEDKNQESGEALGIAGERIYADYRQMAKEEAGRPDGIQFVSIVTPNATHFEISKAFLEQGIHVMCEKPLTFTVKEAEELQALAEKNNLLFGVNYSYTGYVMAKVMREMVQTGKIGNIINVNAEYPQEWLLDDLHPQKGQELNLSTWRKDPRITGISNCVGDIGTHIEHFVHYVTGLEIKRLLATTNKFGQSLELNANILVEYDNGANGAYWCSQVAAGNFNGLKVRFFGDEGSLVWEQERPDILHYTPRGEATRVLNRGNAYIREQAASFNQLPAGHPEGLHTAFANIYKSFSEAVLLHQQGKSTDHLDYPRIREGIAGVKFVHAVVTSAAENSRWVTL